MTLVAIDAGQSHVRAVLVGEDSERYLRTAGFATKVVSRHTAERVGRRLADVVVQLAGPQSPDAVRVGLSGFDHGGRYAAVVARGIGEGTRTHNVVVASDAATWYLAAVGTGAGVVAALGTGTVVLAADGTGTWHQVDGWGYLLGDEGSGFAIGRAGLSSALRVADGRGGSAPLLDRVVARHGSVEHLVSNIYAARSSTAAVAKFAVDVAASALEGDPEAVRIWDEAGEAIGQAIVSAYRGVFTAGIRVPAHCVGSLTNAGELLMRRVHEVVRASQPGLEVDVVDMDALSGVRRLAPETRTLFPGLVVDWHAS